MTEPLHPDPVTTGPEQQFLHQVLAHLDRWFDDHTNLDDLHQARNLLHQRIPVAAELDENTHSTRPAHAVLGAELQHARRDGALISIRTRGGHHHHRMVRVDAVHRHHARLTGRTHQSVLLPLAFIESIARLTPGHEQ